MSATKVIAQDYARHIDEISAAPSDNGNVDLIVIRPRSGERKAVEQCEINREFGLVGDRWSQSSKANPLAQVTIMNTRVIKLLEPDSSRWSLAGDNLFVEMDLSQTNLPAGQRLQIGEVILEVTDEPHLGCALFSVRFGKQAVKFVNSELGVLNNCRGINTRVIADGLVKIGDRVSKISSTLSN